MSIYSVAPFYIIIVTLILFELLRLKLEIQPAFSLRHFEKWSTVIINVPFQGIKRLDYKWFIAFHCFIRRLK